MEDKSSVLMALEVFKHSAYRQVDKAIFWFVGAVFAGLAIVVFSSPGIWSVLGIAAVCGAFILSTVHLVRGVRMLYVVGNMAHEIDSEQS